MRKQLRLLVPGAFFRVINDPDDCVYWYNYTDKTTDSAMCSSFDSHGNLRVRRLPLELEVYSV